MPAYFFSFGAGHADLKGIFQTLKEINFTGYVTVYMPLVSRELFNLGFRDMVDKGITPAKADLKSYLGNAIDHLKKIESSEIPDEMPVKLVISFIKTGCFKPIFSVNSAEGISISSFMPNNS